MRSAKRNRQDAARRPKTKHLTQAERLHKRRWKRKNGPAALKRKAARTHLQPKPVVDTLE